MKANVYSSSGMDSEIYINRATQTSKLNPYVYSSSISTYFASKTKLMSIFVILSSN